MKAEGVPEGPYLLILFLYHTGLRDFVTPSALGECAGLITQRSWNLRFQAIAPRALASGSHPRVIVRRRAHRAAIWLGPKLRSYGPPRKGPTRVGKSNCRHMGIIVDVRHRLTRKKGRDPAPLSVVKEVSMCHLGDFDAASQNSCNRTQELNVNMP